MKLRERIANLIDGGRSAQTRRPLVVGEKMTRSERLRSLDRFLGRRSHVKSAQAIRVIEVVSITKGIDPESRCVRNVHEYFSLDGALLARFDPLVDGSLNPIAWDEASVDPVTREVSWENNK